ncbi:MAG: WD40 repeat domain-containing protein [Planctomycetaceae bacterium]|nr:WD40 repeat domain-containing protein [Planctomycetaceae bacterium]
MKSILAKNYWLKFAALLIVTSLCLVPNAEQVWRQPISTIDQATESGLAKSKLARPRRAPITSQEIDATAEPHLDNAETRANQVCFLLAAARRDAGRYLEAIQLLEQIPPKYRHLEWYLLRRELDGGYMTYFGHRHTVTQAEFSADGSLVLSTDSGGRLKVWDAVTGAALHDHYIDGTATSFSPDTKFIAIGKSDGKVTLLDSATGCELKTMEISDSQINALSISDDAKLLACGTEESLHVLNIDTGVKLFSLVGHTSDVKQVAFNPETTKLASITSDCIKLWDLNTGSELLSIDDHSSWKANVKFSPDGSKLATGSLQENAKVWNVATGTLEFTLSGMSGDLTSLCFNPQGTRIATGSDDHTIKLWDAENGQEIRMLRGHLDEVGCISFSSDGSKILSGSSDGTIKVWKSDEEQFTRTLWGEADDVEDASLSADGMRIASICFNGRLRIWDAESGHQLRSIAVPAANSRRLCLNVDGTKVAIGSEQGIAVWSTETGEVIQTLIGRGGEIHSIQFDPTGDKVAALRNGAIDIWDIATGTHKPLRNDSDSIVSFCFSHDGKWIAAGGYDGLMLWEAETGELRDLITALSQSISHLTFIRESSQLVSTSNVNGASIVTFWDVDTWRELNSIGLAPRPGLLKTVTINANGSRLFTLDTKGQVHLWDADSGQQLLKLVSTTDAHEAMNFSLDEKRVMLCGRDGEIHILDTDFTSEYEHESRLLIGHHDRVTNARFAPDEKTIVTSSNDRTLREWDTLNGQLLRTFRGHIGRISNFVVSEDAERIVSSGDFGELKLWDLSSGTELETLSDYSPGEPSRYHAVAFSPDGQCLAMVNQDNSLSLFEASTGFELHNMTGHVADVFALFFEGNGQRLVSAASDGTLKLWAVDRGCPINC